MGIQRQINRIQQNIENTYAVMEALGADLPEEQTSDNLSATAGTAKVVLYKEQTLTEAEKAQARNNIGLDNNSITSAVKSSLPTLTLVGTDADGVAHTWTIYGS